MTAPKPPTLISAGAGSGKTYRIVATVLERVRAGTPVDRVAAVTFTEAAAAELQDRLRAALTAEGLDAEAARVDVADICTIHRFSLALLRRYPLLAGLPPDPLVLDEEQSRALLAQALGAEVRESAERVRALVEGGLGMGLNLKTGFGGVTPERRLEGAVFSVIEKSRSLAMDADALESEGPRAASRITEALGPSGDPAGLESALTAALDDAFAYTDEEPEAPTKTDAPLWETLRGLRFAKGLSPLDRAMRVVAHEASKKAQKRVGPLFAAAQAVVDAHPAMAERIGDTVRGVYAVAAAVLRRYGAEKNRIGAVDFEDMQSLALALLTGRGGGEPYAPLVAKALPFIVVDEFQDTSPLQFRIFEALREAGAEVRYVGDLKQGIYGFRTADSALFAALLARAERLGEPVETLDRSRRSRPELVEFANALFGRALPAEGLPFTPLTAENDYSEGRCPKGEPSVEVIKGGVRDRRSLLRAAVERAAALIDAGCPVLDRATRAPRPARWGDVAVLARKRSQLDDWAAAFRARGVAVQREAPSLFSTLEVQLALAWLRMVASPRDRAAAAGVLLSELYGLRQETVARLSLARALGSPRRALEVASVDPKTLPLDDFERRALERCRDDLTACRAALRERPLPDAVHYAFDRVDLAARLETRLGPTAAAQLRANLAWVIARARSLARATSSGLSLVGASGATLENLILVLERDRDDDPAQPRALEQDPDAVRLVTLHGSKGMEYPVVLLDTIGESVDVRLPRAEVLRPVGDEALLAPDALDRSGVQWVPDVGAATARQKLASLFDGPAEQRREWLRLLYVAVTRARDHLVILWPEPAGAGRADTLRGLVLDHAPPPPAPGAPATWMGVPVRVGAASRDEAATAATSAVDLSPWRAITEPLTTPDPESVEETQEPDTEPDACGNPRLSRVSPSELCQVADCPEVPRLARVYARHALARTDKEPVAVHSIPGAWAERTALSDEAVPPSRLGLLVHSAVERARLLGGVASDDAADRAMVAEVLSRHGQSEHAAAIEALIVRTLDALRAAVSVLGATREPAREVPFAVDLRGTTLRGVIDLVVEAGDALHVIDLKTHALQRDHLARWAGYYQPQLDAYAVALERVTGRKVAGRHLAVPAAGALVTLQSEYDRMSSEEQLFRLGRAMALGVRGPTRDCGRCGWNGECGVGRAILKRERAAPA